MLLQFCSCAADDERPSDNAKDDDGAGADEGSDSDIDTDTDLDSDSDLDWDAGDIEDPDPCVDPGSSNQGCEFWAVDLPNVSVAPLSVKPHDQQFAVVVANTSADEPAEVSIYLGADTNPSVTQSVPVDDIVTFKLPSQNIQPGATTSNGTAYRIESNVPITAYQFNPLDNTTPVYSNDASLLFPVHVLSKDYTAITGAATLVGVDAFSASDNNTGGFVAVVANEDNTTVTLYPTKTLYPGPYQNVVLNKGQVLTAIGSGKRAEGNLSGTRVQADKPVAVFSGSVATSEPTGTSKCCADHVEHQMLPLEAWGSKYTVAPAAAAKGGGDHSTVLRISAAFDNTQLEYSPQAPDGAPTVLDAYQTVEFITDQPFTVSSGDPDKPFSVTQFLLSNQVFSSLSYPGDPSMIVLPAEDQFQKEYIFLVPQGYQRNWVTIIIPAGAEVILDGAQVAETFSPLGTVDGTDYGYAHVRLQPGHHRIESEKEIAITVAGYSDDVSFGYPGGSGVEVIVVPPPVPE